MDRPVNQRFLIKLANRLLESLCSYDFLEFVIADLEDIHAENLKKKSRLMADLIYLVQAADVTFRIFSKGKSKYSPNKTAMIKSLIVLSTRSLWRFRQYTLLNLLSLIISFTSVFIIINYIRYEVGYDQHFSQYDNIARVNTSSIVGGNTNLLPTTYPAVGQAMKDQLAGVKAYTRILNYKYSRMKPTVQYKDNLFYENKVILADSSFFQVFDFPFKSGNPDASVLKPGSIVLTASMADKYFGNEPAVGKLMKYNGDTDLIVTAVLEDLPQNCHVQFDFILPLANIDMSGFNLPYSALSGGAAWSMDWFWTYLLLEPESSLEVLNSQLPEFSLRNMPDNVETYKAALSLEPFAGIHLHSDFQYGTDLVNNSSISSLYIYISVAILLALIGVVNFANLSLALSTRRSRQVGITKILGAHWKSIRSQQLLECF